MTILEQRGFFEGLATIISLSLGEKGNTIYCPSLLMGEVSTIYPLSLEGGGQQYLSPSPLKGEGWGEGE
jgi:hypothetical protein